MKLLKNKKFWAITLGVTLVGAGVVAVAASCSSSNVKSKLSSQLVKSKDEKSFYAVYDIENFDDLNENDKKALNEAEFNVAITSAENKTENATTKGQLLNKKIYVKLPREPKAKEQLTIINKGGLLKTASLVLPDNLNYQTDKVDFGNAPTPSPTPTPEPTPTPTPKEDKVVVSKVELVEINKEKKQAKVKIEFSELSLKDEAKKVIKLTLTKKDTQESQEVELELSTDKKSAISKTPFTFSTDIYKVTKLTLNETNIDLTDVIKNQELKVEATNEQSDQPSDPQKNKEAKIKELQEKLEATKKELEKAKEDENAKKKVADATIETLNKAEASKNEQSIKDAKEKSTKANSDYKKAKELVLEKEAALNLIKEELKELGVKIEDDAGSTGK